jgi:urease accessory protein
MCPPDAAVASAPAAMQRARGVLSIAIKQRDGASGLAVLRQQGCLKARLPRPADPAWPEIISLNNSGGVAGGDQLATGLDLQPGTRAVFTTASAERVYRAGADDAPARIDNRLELAAGAGAEWLPQETILFDGSALHRRLEITMAGSASLLGVETLIFGRLAMGETLRQVMLRDVIRIRRDGRLILQDAVRPPPDIAAILPRRAVGGNARASTTLFLVRAQAGAALDGVRGVLAAHPAVQAGASAWDGMLVVRLLAEDPAAARRAVVELLHLLRAGRMLPRVWQC